MRAYSEETHLATGIPVNAPPTPLATQPGGSDRALKGVIVLSDHGWVSGGQAKIAIESALQLKLRGLDVCFIAGTAPIDDRLIAAGIECHSVGAHDILSDPNRIRAACRGMWNSAAARLLSECLAVRDPRSTVIHVHGWAKALSPSIGPVIARSAAAHVYTLHEYFLACPNGGFYDYRAGKICRRRPLGFDCLTTRCDARADVHKAWRVARQVVLKSASRLPGELREIIYLAPEQIPILKPYVSPHARWHHLPNPVGTSSPIRVPVERNDTFLFIGRLSPEKGAEVAAEAAGKAGVPIGFCGDGPCSDAVRRANPEAQMLGWLGKDELFGWMQRARCLVFPSLWYEGYPLVIADALRLGLPVIVSKSSIAASLISHAETGLHVPAGDVDAWAQAMTLLRSNVFARELGQAAFRAGALLLDENDYTSRLIGIYEMAILRKHGAMSSKERTFP